MLLVTVLPLSTSTAWYIRGLDFPRLQFFFLALTLGTVLDNQPYSLHPIAVLCSLLLAVVTLVQLYHILPYTFLGKTEVFKARPSAPGPKFKLRLVTANIMMSNQQAQRCKHVIASSEADIILFVETNRWWYNQLSSFKITHPYTLSCPLENSYGMLLFSKYKLINPKIEYLVEEGIPSISTQVQLSTEKIITLVGLHPAPPTPPGFQHTSTNSTERDTELLLTAKAIQKEKRPVIVMGDLNDVAWSRSTSTFKKISGLKDPRRGRGLYNTFHAKCPLLRFPLDHFFISKHFKFIKLRRLPKVGSDHFPILLDISLENANAHSPHPDA